MDDPGWLHGEVARVLIDDVVVRVLKQYRIADEAARELVESIFAKHRKLAELIASGKTAVDIQRTRLFEEAAVLAKRSAYQELRRYSADQERQAAWIAQLESATTPAEAAGTVEELVRSHASTRERIPAREEFYAKLQEWVENPRSILDVGCGMHPLMHPGEGPLAPEIYVGADKDATPVAAVNAHGRLVQGRKVAAIQWDIREGWEPVLAAGGVRQFDVAYIFKVIPVVQRQAPELWEVLAQTPAHRWVITGSVLALAKKRDIERRERGALLKFCREAGGKIIGEFAVGEEIGMVVERGR